MRRANNEDSASVLLADSQERWQRQGHLFVVADGMGAHAAGEKASRMAVESILHHFLKSTVAQPTDALRQAIASANSEIHRSGRENPEFMQMGTTASVLALLPGGALIAHVGDSRVYRLRGDQLEQLTFDHSLVWELQAAGQITEGSSLGESIGKNVITRSLGPNADITVDMEGPLPLQQGDVFLLCSDGLSGQVSDEEIGVLIGALPAARAVRVLIDLANLRGGPDNITAIVARVTGPSIIGPAAPPVVRREPLSPPLLATAAICGLCSLGFAVTMNIPLAVVTGLMTLTSLAVAIYYQAFPPKPKHAPIIAQAKRGAAPYRRFTCKPSDSMVARLRSTVTALREAADERDWLLEWKRVQQFQDDANQASQKGNWSEAVRLQAEAVIETMNQLREQHRRQAADSTVDY
jgi:protein phosphatase